VEWLHSCRNQWGKAKYCSGVLVPEKKDCYFSTIGGFLAIVPLYIDVFLGLWVPAAYKNELRVLLVRPGECFQKCL